MKTSLLFLMLLLSLTFAEYSFAETIPASWSMTEVSGHVDKGLKSVPIIYAPACKGKITLEKAGYKLDVRDKARMTQAMMNGADPADFYFLVKKKGKVYSGEVKVTYTNGGYSSFDLDTKSGKQFFSTNTLRIPKFWSKIEVTCE
jgi:hypothetical protein